MFYEGLRLWEARFVVSYEGLRVWEARFVVFCEGLRLWEARSVVFYEGLRLWEARSVMFYEGVRLWGVSVSNQAVREGGSAKERPSRAWGVGGGGGGCKSVQVSRAVMQMLRCGCTCIQYSHLRYH